MNKEKLKKLIYDLEITMTDLKKSIEFLEKYKDNEDLKTEFSNSLKYKYLSLFIIYEDFISMSLKEFNLYEIGLTVDKSLLKLKHKEIITDAQYNFLNSARLIRNKIGHRYKQPPTENIIEFLIQNNENLESINNVIKSFL